MLVQRQDGPVGTVLDVAWAGADSLSHLWRGDSESGQAQKKGLARPRRKGGPGAT